MTDADDLAPVQAAPDVTTAKWGAQLSEAAYAAGADLKTRLTALGCQLYREYATPRGGFAYLAFVDKFRCVVGFRGTDTLGELLGTDLYASMWPSLFTFLGGPTGYAPYGFVEQFDALVDATALSADLEDLGPAYVLVTGHSLGAALALYMAGYVRYRLSRAVHCVAVATPPAGDGALLSALHSTGFTLQRVVKPDDPVVRLPSLASWLQQADAPAFEPAWTTLTLPPTSTRWYDVAAPHAIGTYVTQLTALAGAGPGPSMRWRPVGGSGGGPFDDADFVTGDPNRAVLAVTVHAGGWIDAVQVTYDTPSPAIRGDATTDLHGGTSSGSQTFVLPPGVVISGVDVYYDPSCRPYVQALRFVLSDGTSHQYGDVTGAPALTARADAGYAITALVGASGQYLDNVGFYETPLPPIGYSGRSDLMPVGGDRFDDASLATARARIEVLQVAATDVIGGLAVTYRDTVSRVRSIARHGDVGTGMDSVQLDEDERIVRVRGQSYPSNLATPTVNALAVQTTKRLLTWGKVRRGATTFDWAAEPGGQIIGFAGWSAAQVDGLAAILAPWPGPEQVVRDTGWRGCPACAALWHPPAEQPGVCAGSRSGHQTGAQPFLVPRNDAEAIRSMQLYWCTACGVMFADALSKCPATGSYHDRYGDEAFVYTLDPEDAASPGDTYHRGWSACLRCATVFDTTQATDACPAGGVHTPIGPTFSTLVGPATAAAR